MRIMNVKYNRYSMEVLIINEYGIARPIAFSIQKNRIFPKINREFGKEKRVFDKLIEDMNKLDSIKLWKLYNKEKDESVRYALREQAGRLRSTINNDVFKDVELKALNSILSVNDRMCNLI